MTSSNMTLENNKEEKVMSEKNLFYVSGLEDLNGEERKTNRASYLRVLKTYVSNYVLCNNIEQIDQSIWDNVANLEDLSDEESDSYREIYQFLLCNLNEYEKQRLIDCGIIVSYSDMLDLDVIMVDHWGTSWDYVMTDTIITTNYEEYSKVLNED